MLTYLSIAVIIAAAIVLACLLARDVLRCLARANLLYERDECYCSRHRLCEPCLRALREERPA